MPFKTKVVPKIEPGYEFKTPEDEFETPKRKRGRPRKDPKPENGTPVPSALQIANVQDQSSTKEKSELLSFPAPPISTPQVPTPQRRISRRLVAANNKPENTPQIAPRPTAEPTYAINISNSANVSFHMHLKREVVEGFKFDSEKLFQSTPKPPSKTHPVTPRTLRKRPRTEEQAASTASEQPAPKTPKLSSKATDKTQRYTKPKTQRKLSRVKLQSEGTNEAAPSKAVTPKSNGQRRLSEEEVVDKSETPGASAEAKEGEEEWDGILPLDFYKVNEYYLGHKILPDGRIAQPWSDVSSVDSDESYDLDDDGEFFISEEDKDLYLKSQEQLFGKRDVEWPYFKEDGKYFKKNPKTGRVEFDMNEDLKQIELPEIDPEEQKKLNEEQEEHDAIMRELDERHWKKEYNEVKAERREQNRCKDETVNDDPPEMSDSDVEVEEWQRHNDICKMKEIEIFSDNDYCPIMCGQSYFRAWPEKKVENDKED